MLAAMKRLIVALMLLFAPLATPAHAATLVFSGVVVDQGKNRELDHFTHWLEISSGIPLTPRYVESYQALTDHLRAHPDDLAWTCGAPFVQDYLRDGQQLVAVPLFHGKPLYHSVIITDDKHPQERSLADFKGQVFAYSDPRSNSGFVAPSFELARHGLDIHRHFRLLLRTDLHENTIRAVLSGMADVGAVDEYVLVEYERHHPDVARKLRIVEQYGPYPFTPIVAGRDVPPAAIARLRRALSGMTADNEGKRILRDLGLDGFVVRPVSFYAPIAQMLGLKLQGIRTR